MFESQSPIAILGLILSICGTLATGHALIERLIGSTLFSTLLSYTPKFLNSLIPYEPALIWFEIRSSNRDIYYTWDLSLIYLVLLSLVLFVMGGFWVFLVLKLIWGYDIGLFWLIFWLAILCFNYYFSASNQAAFKMKILHPYKLKSPEDIKNYMRQNPIETLKLWTAYFFRNWIAAPFTTLILLLIVVLNIVLHWPAWLIQVLPKVNKINLADSNTRKYYYIGYMLSFLIPGLILIFFFS